MTGTTSAAMPSTGMARAKTAGCTKIQRSWGHTFTGTPKVTRLWSEST